MSNKCNISILDRLGPTQLRDEDYNGVAVYCLLDDETVISAGDDYRIRVWNWSTGDEEKVMYGDKHHSIECMALSSDKKLLATGHGSWGGIHVWDIGKGGLLWCDDGMMYVESVAFTANDSQVLVHEHGDEVKKYNTETGELTGTIGHDFDDTLPSCFSPDGESIYFFDKSIIRSVSTSSGKENWSIKMDRSEYGYEKTISPDGSMLCFIDADRNVRILRTKDGALGPSLSTSDFAKSEYDYLLARFLPDNYHVMVYVEEIESLQIWDIASSRLVCETTIEDDVYIVQDIVVFDDNKRFVAGDRTGKQFIGTLENLSQSDTAIAWDVQEQSEFLKFSGRFALNRSGYCWYSEEFVEQLGQAELPEIIDYIKLLMEPSSRDNALTVNLLNEILEVLQEHGDVQEITIDVLLDMLMQSTLSPGAALHDPNGELTAYAEQSAAKLNTIGVSAFSANQKKKLHYMYDRVMHFVDELQQIEVDISLPDKSLCIIKGPD